MDKYIYDKKNGLWYELQGEYYLPYLTTRRRKAHRDMGAAAFTVYQGA